MRATPKPSILGSQQGRPAPPLPQLAARAVCVLLPVVGRGGRRCGWR
jgi:hypothetical protein